MTKENALCDEIVAATVEAAMGAAEDVASDERDDGNEVIRDRLTYGDAHDAHALITRLREERESFRKESQLYWKRWGEFENRLEDEQAIALRLRKERDAARNRATVLEGKISGYYTDALDGLRDDNARLREELSRYTKPGHDVDEFYKSDPPTSGENRGNNGQ